MRIGKQAGFTLIEVVLAMAIFCFMLLIIVAGFLNIMNVYEAGLAVRTTQQNTRFGMDDVIQSGHSAYNVVIPTPIPNAGYGGSTPDQICLYEPGGMEQYYVHPTDFALYKIQQSVSTPCVAAASGGQPVTSGDVGVVSLSANISPATATSPYQFLSLTLGFSPETAIQNSSITYNGSTPECPPGVTNANFCSITILSSTVSLQGINPQGDGS